MANLERMPIGMLPAKETAVLPNVIEAEQTNFLPEIKFALRYAFQGAQVFEGPSPFIPGFVMVAESPKDIVQLPYGRDEELAYRRLPGRALDLNVGTEAGSTEWLSDNMLATGHSSQVTGELWRQAMIDEYPELKRLESLTLGFVWDTKAPHPLEHEDGAQKQGNWRLISVVDNLSPIGPDGFMHTSVPERVRNPEQAERFALGLTAHAQVNKNTKVARLTQREGAELITVLESIYDDKATDASVMKAMSAGRTHQYMANSPSGFDWARPLVAGHEIRELHQDLKTAPLSDEQKDRLHRRIGLLARQVHQNTVMDAYIAAGRAVAEDPNSVIQENPVRAIWRPVSEYHIAFIEDTLWGYDNHSPGQAKELSDMAADAFREYRPLAEQKVSDPLFIIEEPNDGHTTLWLAETLKSHRIVQLNGMWVYTRGNCLPYEMAAGRTNEITRSLYDRRMKNAEPGLAAKLYINSDNMATREEMLFVDGLEARSPYLAQLVHSGYFTDGTIPNVTVDEILLNPKAGDFLLTWHQPQHGLANALHKTYPGEVTPIFRNGHNRLADGSLPLRFGFGNVATQGLKDQLLGERSAIEPVPEVIQVQQGRRLSRGRGRRAPLPADVQPTAEELEQVRERQRHDLALVDNSENPRKGEALMGKVAMDKHGRFHAMQVLGTMTLAGADYRSISVLDED